MDHDLKKEVANAFGWEDYEAPSDEPSGETIIWNGQEYEIPSDAEIEDMCLWDNVAETPDGRIVEPDHPDSWPRILGLI